MSGSGISWAICKSAHRCRQITTPTSYHSVFTGRMPFLAPNQQCQSTEGTVLHLVIHYLCEMTPILDLMFGCVSRNLKCFYKNKTCDTLAKAQILSVAHRAGMQKFLWLLPLDGCCWHRAHSLFSAPSVASQISARLLSGCLTGNQINSMLAMYIVTGWISPA